MGIYDVFFYQELKKLIFADKNPMNEEEIKKIERSHNKIRSALPLFGKEKDWNNKINNISNLLDKNSTTDLYSKQKPSNNL